MPSGHMGCLRRVHVEPELSVCHAGYLRAFAATERIRRDDAEFFEPPGDAMLRLKVGLPIGVEGAYFTSTDPTFYREARLGTAPPRGQPCNRCAWLPCPGGLAWTADGEGTSEEWFFYLRAHFLAPWGYRAHLVCRAPRSCL